MISKSMLDGWYTKGKKPITKKTRNWLVNLKLNQNGFNGLKTYTKKTRKVKGIF